MPSVKTSMSTPFTDVPETSGLADLPHESTKALPIALLRAREALMSKFRPMLAAHDFTTQQWRVIRLLFEYKTLDAAQLAEKAFILPPSLTRILAALEKRDLIIRLQSEKDRRRYLFSLTPKGENALHVIAPDRLKIYREIEAYFGKQKIQLLLELLDQLAEF